jgi:hypothetical protein
MLVDEEARDVSRITGIPWAYERIHQRGVLHPVIRVDDLGWWDRWQIVWATIGVRFYLESACSPSEAVV